MTTPLGTSANTSLLSREKSSLLFFILLRQSSSLFILLALSSLFVYLSTFPLSVVLPFTFCPLHSLEASLLCKENHSVFSESPQKAAYFYFLIVMGSSRHLNLQNSYRLCFICSKLEKCLSGEVKSQAETVYFLLHLKHCKAPGPCLDYTVLFLCNTIPLLRLQPNDYTNFNIICETQVFIHILWRLWKLVLVFFDIISFIRVND